MKYCKGFKYQLDEDENIQTNVLGFEVDTKYYSLNKEGILTGKAGFAWDGCSGSIDTDTNMRGGLFHDILCLMIARQEIPYTEMSKSNILFSDILTLDDMVGVRRWWHYKAVVKRFAGNTKPQRREIIDLETGGDPVYD